MIKWFKSIYIWCAIAIHTLMVRIAIALHNSEEDIMKADPNLAEKDKKNQRMQHRNPVINKMEQGQRDEKFVQDYYEILKKADKFMKNATPEKIAMTADKFGMNYGMKDKWGRRYEHYGFYDPKSKYYGLTLAEVIEKQIEERKTKDDDYPLEFMFDNSPIEEGLSKITQIKETMRDVSNTGFEALNELEKAKIRKFPLKIVRSKDVINKIEQLTSYIHVKKVTEILEEQHRILEFFIPKFYKVFDLSEKSDIFEELINIEQVWLTDEYGSKYGYQITGFRKMIDFDNQYGVIKFNAIKIKEL